MKLSDALIKYLAWGKFQNKSTSIKTYQTHLRGLVLFMHNCDIEKVKIDDIIKYIELMKEVGVEARSFGAKCSAYKQFFNFFKKQDFKVLDASLIPFPEFEYKFPKMIEEEDYKKLLAVCGNKNLTDIRVKFVINLLWDTGMRLNEMLSLNLKDLDFVNMRAAIKTEKSRGVKPVRMIFWSKKTNQILREYLEIRENILKYLNCEDTGILFIAGKSRWNGGKRISEATIGQSLQLLSIKANLGYCANAHRFRHRFGRNLAMQGANNSIISDMMGHADMNSTRIYTVMNDQMMQDTYKKYFKD